ncbi:MAG: hypothetical protein H5T74_09605 [Actinobacteria bacterium]|nr:hypothetical protein [Actinomycetota bacterium]
MVTVNALKGKPRMAAQSMLVLAAAATLTVPPLAVALSGTGRVSFTWTTLRLLGLYAITVLFLNVITGSLRPLLAKVFKPGLLFRLHNNTGLAGFAMAVAHMVLVITYGLWPGFQKLGPVTLYAFTVTTVAILLRRYMKKWWRTVHRLNYAVFTVALVHAFQVGTDLKATAFLDVVLYIYAGLAAVGFLYRAQLEIRKRIRRKAPHEGPAHQREPVP